MKLFKIYALSAVIWLVTTTVFGAAVLPASEVETLRQIGSTLGKDNWDFSLDPCGGEMGWNMSKNNFVGCNCSYSTGTVCHVQRIILKEQNLTGSLPPEIVNLPFLQDIDVTRNYLNGTIPKEWGKTQLVNISLLGNRISGRIPPELGNISTLTRLVLEFNQLSGPIPPELGNLSSIEYMFFTSNNLSGELPIELGKLKTMKDFRIGDNNFGKIPSFIGNWINLNRLAVQASGLEGPVPGGISRLTNMKNLRISDINGIESLFPPIINLQHLETLILRSCNLIGPLPPYLGNMINLTTLYFTGNLLNGIVPDWIIESNRAVDISFNNFSQNNNFQCEQGSVNLFASSPSITSETVSCMGNLTCQDSHTLNINCGGPAIRIGNINYEEDIYSGGSAYFYKGSNWALSNTGHFLDNNRPLDSYVASTSIVPGNSSLLSLDARLTPLSLTYYGFCLINGNYSVKLHFAEIMFTNDTTYSSLGRRIFDVYIQGTRVLKDFNIENEAGGVGIEIVKPFSAVVTNRTLEIQLRWSGKGTISIPVRGTYGPLISAISVDLPEFSSVFSQPGKKGISVGAIIGIIFSVTFVIILIAFIWRKGCLRHKNTMYRGKPLCSTMSRTCVSSSSSRINISERHLDRRVQCLLPYD